MEVGALGRAVEDNVGVVTPEAGRERFDGAGLGSERGLFSSP